MEIHREKLLEQASANLSAARATGYSNLKLNALTKSKHVRPLALGVVAHIIPTYYCVNRCARW